MRTTRHTLLALSLLLLVPSCKRITLHESEGNLHVDLQINLKMDISVSSDMDLDANPALKEKVEGKKPEWLRACFYDTVTHKLVAEDFISADGGFVNVPGGTYDVVIYNLGNEATQVAGTETRAGAYAFTSAEGTRVKVTKTKADNTEETTEYEVVNEPDHLLVGRMEGLVVPDESAQDRSVNIGAQLTSLLETFTFEVSTVTGGEHIASAEVYITDQALGRYLWDGRYVSRPCAMHVPAVVDPDKGVLYTVFNTFGKYPDSTSEVYLNVQVVGESGGRYQWTYDVTEQVTNPDNTSKAIVINEPMEVPDDSDPSSGGGLQPSVTEWNSEIIEIPLF